MSTTQPIPTTSETQPRTITLSYAEAINLLTGQPEAEYLRGLTVTYRAWTPRDAARWPSADRHHRPDAPDPWVLIVDTDGEALLVAAAELTPEQEPTP